MIQKTAVLKQPEFGTLIREFRQLTALTQEQFASVLGVTYSSVDRCGNGRMQPYPLGLKQIRVLLKRKLLSTEGQLTKPLLATSRTVLS